MQSYDDYLDQDVNMKEPVKGNYNEDIRKAKWYLDRLVTKLGPDKAV